MALIKIKRGLQVNVQDLVLQEGELAVALDTGNVYVGTTAGSHHINPPGGIADVALKLQTARNISITGDGTASAISFDGTQPVALALTLATMAGLTAGTYTKLTVDAKGRVTAGNNITISDVSGLGTAASKNTGTTSGTIPILGSDGKLDAGVLPALAISDTFVVSTQAAMLALTAQTGDICVRTDLSKSYILTQSPATTLANWQELLTPNSPVQSVAGKTGVVVLVKGDVGLGNVDNTADSAKSVASAAKLTTSRTIALSGGVTGTATAFDGSKNITIAVTSVDANKIDGTFDGGTF
ncbi:MAG: hypothetical protein ACK5L0_04910 [Candidatus Fimivivens sp.]